MVVALVLLLNSIIIGIEADLGLLGMDGRDWGSVKEDLTLLGYRHSALTQAQGVVHQALSMDDKYKSEASDYSNADTSSTSSKGSALRKGAHVSDGAYTLIEYLFMLFYTLELFARACNQGCRASCTDLWMCFDLLVWLLGVVDLVLPIALKFQSFVPLLKNITTHELYELLSVLRIARVLRVLRFFRVVPELRALFAPFMNALWVVFRIACLVLLIDFFFSIVLTTLVGQRSQLSQHPDQVSQQFGSIGRCMETLLSIMTLNGWQRVSVLLTDYVPGYVVLPVIVLYIMLCTLVVYGIVTGTICESFAFTRRQEQKIKDRGLAAHRFQLEQALKDKFETAGKIKEEYLTRSEFERLIYNEWYMAYDIQVIDPEMTTERMLQVFDQLVRDNPDSRDFVRGDTLAEAIANQSCEAPAFALIDFKYQCRAARREMNSNTASLRKDMTERHKEGMDMKKHVHEDQTKLKKAVSIVQVACNHVREKFKQLGDRMGTMDKASDSVRHERKQVFEQIRLNVKGLTKDVNAALREQTQKTGEQVKVVQTNAQEASKTITTMKKTVDDLPDTIKKSTRRLELEVKNISNTVIGLVEHANVKLDSDTNDILTAAANEEIAPEEEETPAEEEVKPQVSEDLNGEKVFGAATSEKKGGAEGEGEGGGEQ